MTVAAALLVGSETDVAITVTVGFVGSTLGAVKVVGDPSAAGVGDTLPQAAAHGIPFCASDQLSWPAAESYVTLPVNSWVAFNGIIALTGVTPTVIARTLTVAETCTAGALTEFTVRVTVRSVGIGPAGAVYVTAAPLAEVVGETVPQSLAPHCTVQARPALTADG
jgi:hypothetical protein